MVTDQGGPKEIVENDRSGLVLPGGDAELLARAMDGILSDPALRARMSNGALERAALYRPEASRDEHLAFYREVLASGGVTGAQF